MKLDGFYNVRCGRITSDLHYTEPYSLVCKRKCVVNKAFHFRYLRQVLIHSKILCVIRQMAVTQKLINLKSILLSRNLVFPAFLNRWHICHIEVLFSIPVANTISISFQEMQMCKRMYVVSILLTVYIVYCYVKNQLIEQ